MGRTKGSRNKPKVSILEQTRRHQITLSVIERVAAETTIKLKPLGFNGFSARMLQSEVNEQLEFRGVPLIPLPKLKEYLFKLGYEPKEKKYEPTIQAMYSAWIKEGK